MTFKSNYAGIHDLLNSREVEAMLLAHMEERKLLAIALAPVGWTGRYKTSFVVEAGVKKDRVKAVLRNDAPEAMAVEFGAGQTPRHRVLGKALGVV